MVAAVVGAALFLEVYALGNSCVIFLSRIPWREDVTTKRKNKRRILRSVAKTKPNKSPIKIPPGQRKYQPLVPGLGHKGQLRQEVVVVVMWQCLGLREDVLENDKRQHPCVFVLAW